MFSKEFLKKLKENESEWQNTTLTKYTNKYPERLPIFKTASGIHIKQIYTPVDIESLDYERDLGQPGTYPFTRGPHPTMYRGRLWTLRQFSGYGSAEETNQRFKYLLAEGETGLSTAFDFPTINGYDSDSQKAIGEVGVCGVAIDMLEDMERLFEGIALDRVTTSMTINMPTPVLLAMYLVVGEKQGVPMNQLGGTVQNDALKEFIAQKSFIFPPDPAVKLVVDVVEYCTKYVPRWNTISISGYHIREAGATAVQELAFTLADGLAYVESAIKRGLDIDKFAPRLSHFFAAYNDLFEEVAKFRAARRMWARFMKERFGATTPRSMWMRFHTQTSGFALTAQQPENNVARVTIQALAAVLGGTQSLHTNSMDEAWALPSEKAVRIAVRTQQIIAHESGVTKTVDPLAGSYYIEWLTNRIEEEAMKYIDRIDEMGGMVEAVKRGYPQREIAKSAYQFQREVDEQKQIICGVNEFADPEERIEIPLLRIDPEIERRQLERLRQVKQQRNQASVERALNNLEKAAEQDENVMPFVIEAVKDSCTLGEIIDTLKTVYGEYQEKSIF